MSELTSFQIMTDKRLVEVEQTLKEVQSLMNKLYLAVTGSDEFDQDGLIKRIKKLEKEAENTKAFKNKVMGMSAIGGALLAGVFELIKAFIK